jgi:methylmalonyl-CoA/ethylmalonyl-CoA epimerase
VRLDHVGIATDDAATLATFYTDLLAYELAHEEAVDDLQVAFVDAGNTYLELLEPQAEDSTVARFLDQHGQGLHHLAFEVEDCAAALDTARDLDIALVDDEPRPGAWGHTVAFLHPRDTGGILTEFVEH